MCRSFDSHLLNYCCKTKHLSTQLSPISSTQQDSSKYLIFADKTLLKCLPTMELNMVVLEVNLWKKSTPLNQNDGVTNIQLKWQLDKNLIPVEAQVPAFVLGNPMTHADFQLADIRRTCPKLWASAQRVGFFSIGSGRVGYWTKYRVAGRVRVG